MYANIVYRGLGVRPSLNIPHTPLHKEYKQWQNIIQQRHTATIEVSAVALDNGVLHIRTVVCCMVIQLALS